MKIALDAHGGDFGTAPNVEGAARAVRDFDCEVLLVGDSSVLGADIKRLGLSGETRIKIVHSDKVAGMGAEPVQECKDKPDCTIMVCAELAANGEADAMISAGNSGATMVASFLKMGRIKGISRPAIATPLPTVKGNCVLLDGGANTECKPVNLLHFAVCGSVYAEKILGIKNPSVGILSVGEEETKGNTLVKETLPLLKRSGLNFYGPVEGRDIPFGTTDVVVCDGFVGNVVLKLAEGMGKAMMEIIKAEINSRPLSKLGAALAMPAFRAVKEKTNPDASGGAPLLGIDGVSIVCHGRSSATAIYNGLRVACELVRTNTNTEIAERAARTKALSGE